MPKVQTQIMPRAFEKMKQIPEKTKKQVKKYAAAGCGGDGGGGKKPSNILPKLNIIKKPIPKEFANKINQLYSNTQKSFDNVMKKIIK